MLRIERPLGVHRIMRKNCADGQPAEAIWSRNVANWSTTFVQNDLCFFGITKVLLYYGQELELQYGVTSWVQLLFLSPKIGCQLLHCYQNLCYARLLHANCEVVDKIMEGLAGTREFEL